MLIDYKNYFQSSVESNPPEIALVFLFFATGVVSTSSYSVGIHMVIHLLSPQNNKSMKNTDDKKVDNEM